jgi:hypothetical protein
LRRYVDQIDFGVGDAGRTRVLDEPLDVRGVLCVGIGSEQQEEKTSAATHNESKNRAGSMWCSFRRGGERTTRLGNRLHDKPPGQCAS